MSQWHQHRRRAQGEARAPVRRREQHLSALVSSLRDSDHIYLRDAVEGVARVYHAGENERRMSHISLFTWLLGSSVL